MDFNELLQIAREFLSCPVCGEHFDRTKIHFRGFIDNKFVIQTECSNNHDPISALFISNVDLKGKPIFQNQQSITANNVLDLKLKLKDFNGDFEELFHEDKTNGTITTQS
jgi:hypothetical protein